MTDQNPEQTPSAVGFGYAEIAYLLKRMSTPEAEMSATVLRLTEEMNSDVLPAAGASSLLGRGFATVVDEEIQVQEAALPVAFALSRATLWTEISLINSDIIDTVVHVESDPVSLLLQPRTLLTWFVFAQDPDVPGPDAELEILQEHVRQHPGGTAMMRARIRGAESLLLVRADGDGWVVGTVEEGEDDVVERTGLTNTELRDAIAELRTSLAPIR
ncbi:hypothetical protein ASF79_12240 [Agreia sp. Leaf335]|uniref:hypothetical protein n=1 Tax=Agreia sp. Leaf335 TaxID=1736340 RepID=UPI0006F5929D|nr:hypothetical protein [Agreia sp. Leaf335]KQR20311.1 hypothetical protein ASF79_12240 [Agreia sp. Leaf335]